MVHLHSIGHVSDSSSVALELVSEEAYLMPTLNQALGQLVAMGLHSSKLGEGEVGADEDAVLSIRPGSTWSYCIGQTIVAFVLLLVINHLWRISEVPLHV